MKPPLPHLLRLIGGAAFVVFLAMALTVAIVAGIGAGTIR